MNPEEAYEEAYFYCSENGRNEQLEKIILTDPRHAYLYARDVINGRWIEAENIISTNSYYSYLYAQHVIKGKLPENMHNAMILHGIINPKDMHVRLYLPAWEKFDLVNKNKINKT